MLKSQMTQRIEQLETALKNEVLEHKKQIVLVMILTSRNRHIELELATIKTTMYDWKLKHDQIKTWVLSHVRIAEQYNKRNEG